MYSCEEILILGRRVRIAVYETEDGINVLIEGGDKGHIGAVAIAGGGNVMESIVFPSHQEDVVCRHWAEKISTVYSGSVIVEAGIHYEGITKKQIQEVLEELEKELEKLVRKILKKQWEQETELK